MPPPASQSRSPPPLNAAPPIRHDRPRRRRRLPLATPAAGHPDNPHTHAPLNADALLAAHPHLAAYLVPGRRDDCDGGGGDSGEVEGRGEGEDGESGNGDGGGCDAARGGGDGGGGGGDGDGGGSQRSRLDLTLSGAIAAVTVAQLSSVWDLKWTVPQGTLIPVLPSRADYLLWASGLGDAVPVAPPTGQGADLALGGSPPPPPPPTWALVDVGTGASVIYPLLATRLFPLGGRVLGVDADAAALAAATVNVDANALGDRITLRHASGGGGGGADGAPNWGLAPGETAALTVCNPPFYDLDEAPAAGARGGAPAARHPHRSPTGGSAQLAVAGGEAAFVSALVDASATAAHRVGWFTTLTGKKATAVATVAGLRAAGVPRVVAAAFQYRRTGRWAVGWSYRGVAWPPLVRRVGGGVGGGGGAATRATLVVDVGATCGGVGAADVTAASLTVLRAAGWVAVGVGGASGSGEGDEEVSRQRPETARPGVETPPLSPELEVVATPAGGVTTTGAVTLVVKRVRAGERLLAEAVEVLVAELTDLLAIGDDPDRDGPAAREGALPHEETAGDDPTGRDVQGDRYHLGEGPGGDNCLPFVGGTGTARGGGVPPVLARASCTDSTGRGGA